MSYSLFARYYDALTSNVDYPARARYFQELLLRHSIGDPGDILLEIGCGTGSLSYALAALGYDVVGIDPSMEMLSVAMQKGLDAERKVLLLNQPMEDLDLYGTVDFAVCALDTVNHIADEDTLARGFARVSLFLVPGGVFAFDVNTDFKHRKVLADNAFVYDLDEVFCVWQNRYCPRDGSVQIALDFFEPTGRGKYIRSAERFVERFYDEDTLRRLLGNAGLELLAVYGEDSFEPAGERCQRLVYVARKPLR